jgi:inner membrane protein
MHFGWLVALSYIGTLTHPLLDWQTAYAVQLASPFSDKWFHNDSLFIIDLWIWIALGLGIGLSQWRERREGNWQRPARVALVFVVAYIGMNAVLTNDVNGLRKDGPDVVYASPPPVLFWQRELAMRHGGLLSWASYDLIRGIGDYAGPVSDNMADPLVRQALSAPELVSFARWSTMPMASIERERCRARISFGDARFGRSVEDNRFREVVDLPVHLPGC